MGGRSYVELAPGITHSNCGELTGWQQLLGRKHQAPTPVFMESLLTRASSAVGHCSRPHFLLNSDISILWLHLLSNKTHASLEAEMEELYPIWPYDLNMSGNCIDNLQLSNQGCHELFKRQMVCFANLSERTNSIVMPTPCWEKEYSIHVEKGCLLFCWYSSFVPLRSDTHAKTNTHKKTKNKQKKVKKTPPKNIHTTQPKRISTTQLNQLRNS